MSNKTPMAILHELMMQRKNSPPIYELIQDGYHPGTYDTTFFKYFVKAANVIAVGTGKSKKEAKHNAAAVLLKLLSLKGIEHKNSIYLTSDVKEEAVINSIGALNDFCHLHELSAPRYSELTEGPAHDARFTVTCDVQGNSCNATSRQKKIAKQQAAKELLQKLNAVFPDTTTSNKKLGYFTKDSLVSSNGKSCKNETFINN